MESIYHKDSNMFRLLNKVKSCSVETVLGWVTKYEYRCHVGIVSVQPDYSLKGVPRASLSLQLLIY